ncbi:hypothetical protein BDZ97DRAFT_1669160, partial [Flammula alnicola]
MLIDRYNPLAQITMFIVVISSVLMGASRRMAELLLSLVCVALHWAFTDGSRDLNSTEQSILDQLPRTLETVLAKFNLEGKTTTYAVCPTCHCTYPP